MDLVEIEGVEFEVEDSDNISVEEFADIDDYFKQEEYVPIPAPIAGPDIEAARALPEEGFPALSERFTERHKMLPKMRFDRPAFSMAGAGAGGVAGLYGGATLGLGAGPGAPVAAPILALAGKEIGETAGAAGGSFVFDIVDEVTRRLQGAPSAPRAGLQKSLESAGTEAAWELGGGQVARLAKFPLQAGKWAGRGLLGVADPAARQIAGLAQKYGAPAGIVHATKRGVLKGATRVLGVLPFVGGPLKESKKEFSKYLGDWAADTLDIMAPTRTMAMLGTDYTQAAMKKFGEVSELVAAKYENYFRLSGLLKNKNIVPTLEMKKMAKQILTEYDAESVDLITTGLPEKELLSSKTIEFLREMVQYPEALTPKQFRAKILKMRSLVSLDVGKEVTAASNWGGRMKTAMEFDWQHPVIDYADKNGRAAMNALKDANEFFHKSMKQFESPTARQFGRVKKGIFDAEASFKEFGTATTYEDTVNFFNSLFNNKSVQGLGKLREIVGEEKFRAGTRAWITEALENATKSQDTYWNKVKTITNEIAGTKVMKEEFSFDVNKLRKNLGLNTEEGVAALDEMLKGTGVDGNDWQGFVDLIDSAESFKVPSASVFMQRRVTLGGIGALYTAGRLGQQSVTGTIMALLLMKTGSKMLVNPEALQTMVRAFDDNISNQLRRKLVMRTARHALGLGAGTSEEPTRADRTWAEEAEEAIIKAGAISEEVGEIPSEIVEATPQIVKDIAGTISDTTWDLINQALE
jgi:hypothetical protein